MLLAILDVVDDTKLVNKVSHYCSLNLTVDFVLVNLRLPQYPEFVSCVSDLLSLSADHHQGSYERSQGPSIEQGTVVKKSQWKLFMPMKQISSPQ